MKKRGRPPKFPRPDDIEVEHAVNQVELPKTNRWPAACPSCGGPRINGTYYHKKDCEGMK